VNKRKIRLPSYRLTSKEHLDLVVERENNKGSQEKKGGVKKEKMKCNSASKQQGKKRIGTESEQPEECKPKRAARGRTSVRNLSGSAGSRAVQEENVIGGQVAKMSKKKAKKGGNKGKRSSVAEDHTPCQFCGKQFNMPEDDKPEDDWIMCGSCKIWAHETCGEKQGIISDA